MISLPIFDVFLSRNDDDKLLAKELYDFLTVKGLEVFDSEYSLHKIGDSNYQRAIDQVLETCSHMIVVASSIENIKSSWVESEWRLFNGQLRANYRQGNIIIAITDDINPQDLPIGLRLHHAIKLEQRNYERFYDFVCRRNNSSEDSIPPLPADTNVINFSYVEGTYWYNKGKDYYDNSNYTKAVICFTKAAEQGHAGSQLSLGRCYYLNQGVQQNHVEAVKWFRKCAEQDQFIAHAQYSLGVCYENGEGIEKSMEMARSCYTKAAKLGYVDAEKRLSNLNSNSLWRKLFSK